MCPKHGPSGYVRPRSAFMSSSVFVSQDPAAIDSVGADFLMNEPAVTSRNGALRDNATVENYLHEAELVSAAPPGTACTDGQGHAVSNLGVHEHWNNSAQKPYGRNLGKPERIELICISRNSRQFGSGIDRFRTEA